MSVIIRLQNLPWSANALDIRQYFRGLSIPEGGVHIVGGELGDAFIAFSTDEDARQAFQLNGGKIKEVQIKLLLSSRTEMQKVIEAARTTQTPFMQAAVPVTAPAPTIIPQVTPSSLLVPVQEIKKEDVKPKDDSKNRRDRSRRRSRSRSRSRDRKDRSRDRRDRRRRDRSRSRDRRDRRRDRRGRSRSRDRTRSKDRDSRRSKDKKDNRTDNKSTDGSTTDLNSEQGILNTGVWDQNSHLSGHAKPQVGLLGNFPAGTSSLEDARRSLGLLAGLQNNLPIAVNDANNGYQRNDTNTNNAMPGNWSRKNRFQDRNALQPDNTSSGIPAPFHAQHNLQSRPMLPQNMAMGVDIRPNMFQNQGHNRMPFNPDGMQGIHRPFLSRPGTLIPEHQFRQQERNSQFGFDRNEDTYRKDNRNNQTRSDCCVQLRPYFGGYGEVRKFFSGLFINNTGLKFVCDNGGKRTGIVYVRFVRPDGKEQALNRSGMLLRGAPVEVAHLDDEEFDRYGTEEHNTNDENQDLRKDENTPLPQKNVCCVIVEDLPEFTKENDIYDMFSEYTLNSVHLVVNSQFRQTAFVQFSNEADAFKALGEKTTHVIGGKPVTVKPILNEVFADIQRQQTNGEITIDLHNFSSNDTNSPVLRDQSNFPANSSQQLVTDVVLLSGMPLKTTDRDVIDFFSDVGLVPNRIHMLMGKFGPTGECYCEFSSPDEAVAALDKNGLPLGSGTVQVELFSRREMERNLGISGSAPSINPQSQGPVPRFQGRFGPRGPGLGGPGPRGPPNMMRRRPGPGPGPYEGPVDVMGPPGCVVSMENVPFKSGVTEILNFFDQFDISEHNVYRRFNDNGAPTGDARVTFNSPAEAHRAVEECHKRKIRERTIYLRLV